MASLDDIIYINTLDKGINQSRIHGKMDSSIIYLLKLLIDYERWTRFRGDFAAQNVHIKDLITTLKFRYPDVICGVDAVLPSESYYTQATQDNGLVDDGSGIDGGPGPGTPVNTSPVLADFTVPAIYKEIYHNSSELYFSYMLTKEDLLANYSDTDDNSFSQLRINRTNLDGGSIKIITGTGVADYAIFEQDPSFITVPLNDVSDIIFFTNDETQTSHDLIVQAIDDDGRGNTFLSPPATITMNKEPLSNVGNQPATIGDGAIKVPNQVTSVLTLAMFTTGLQPPYNDPESDLIDAIRIDEISTANVGEFRLSGVPVITGQIITRAQLEADAFTHVGATSNDIETDSFNFSARDAGSGIWVK